MCDEWMPRLTLPLAFDDFPKLPRHPAYRYEYFDGAAQLTPRPQFVHARLDLIRFLATEPEERTQVRLLTDDDFTTLPGLFAGAFATQQPFGSISDAERLTAAQASLAKTRTGGDGPRLRAASFVAADERQGVIGAILVTLLPGGDPRDVNSFYWPNPVPEALWPSCPGQPHLTWMFVSPFARGHGVAGMLLRRAAEVLQGQGHRELWSTLLVGNETSTLWHWRCGFELLPRFWSLRGVKGE